MDLREMHPEDVLISSWLDSYHHNVEALWWQLVRLNSSIFVLEKIQSFPFDLLLPPGPFLFWSLTEYSFLDTCVMIIWRVAVDNQFHEGLTLRQFKRDILQHLREEHKEPYKKLLKQVGFEKALQAIEPKIYEIRHNYIAHFAINKHVNPSAEQIQQRRLLLSELKDFQKALASLFALLCFGHQRELLPFEYNPAIIAPVDLDLRSDIERLLDTIAKGSSTLNLPEDNPNYWALVRDNLSQQQLEVLNGYRARFGLSEV